MVSGEMDKSSKEAKEVKESMAPTSQEHTSFTNTSTVNPEWSGFQAYSPVPPHGFLASSHQAHSYMWGIQHLMPPYGIPPHPYIAMYPHGGIYTHPCIPPGSYPFSPFVMHSPNGTAEVSGCTPGSMEVDGKPSEGKEKLPIKRSKGSLGSLNMITGKNTEPGKTPGASVNRVSSKSAESVSGSSSEGSDASSQNDSQMRPGNRHDSSQDKGFQNGNTTNGSQHGGPNAPNSMVNQTMSIIPVSTAGTQGGTPGPTTNLNIGMDFWGTATSSPVPAVRGMVPSTPLAGAIETARSGDSVQSQLWLQDERELKKQRRKQSNRESARRSRLRKQAECDELAQRTEALTEENASLRAELNRIRSEYEQLVDRNASLMERLGEVPGQEDPRSRQNDQRIGNHTQQSSHADPKRSGQ